MTTFQNHLVELVTTEELHQQSISDHSICKRVKAGELIRLRHGVYVSATYRDGLPRWETCMLDAAAYFRRHPHAVFSHTTAAQMMNLPVPSKQPVHVYIGKESKNQNSHKTTKSVTKHRLLGPDTRILQLEDGQLVTDYLQTISDCVRMLTAPYGLALADSALHQKLVSMTELRKTLLDSKGRHCRKMRNLAEYLSTKAESPGESHVRWVLLEMEIDFIEQVEIYADGQLYRVDFLADKYGIIVEFDGDIKLTNYGPADEVLINERRREKALQNLGFIVFRVDWDLATRRPNDLRAQLNDLIRKRRRPTFSSPSYQIW